MTTNRPPQWERPDYYGRPAAIDAMGTIAAPFLAGIGIALAVLVISSETDFGAAPMALFALVAATTALIACVECAFFARKYAVTPSELEEWRPDLSEDERTEILEGEQRIASRLFTRWANWARRAYNAGILAFGWGIVSLLVPKGGLAHAHGWRLAAFVLACVAVAAEVATIVIPWSLPHARALWKKRANRRSLGGGAEQASGTSDTEGRSR